jgi:glycosyltransferase involved in cell wall biosynthesis
MQPKVSIAMPCYNKMQYIGKMFDSIIAQKWDNIELILVNDGSTDGTREIIADYEPRFKARGYEVVIVDQENAGVCVAARTGLQRVTGDYVCCIDADDELMPNYVSAMANWLIENKNYDYCQCNRIVRTCDYPEGKNLETGMIWNTPEKDEITIEEYMFIECICATWSFMIRREYFAQCKIIENYIINTRGSHEPSYILPLCAYGGKMKMIMEPLYIFNHQLEGAHSYHTKTEKMLNHWNDYFEQCKTLINNIPFDVINNNEKKRLAKIAEIAKYVLFLSEIEQCDDADLHRENLLNKLIKLVNEHLKLKNPINAAQVCESLWLFLTQIKYHFLNYLKYFKYTQGRIIGYGALGKAAKQLLPIFKGTAFEPTELWDANGDGFTVKKPDFESITESDIVLVFPVADSVKELFKNCKAKVYYNNWQVRLNLNFIIICLEAEEIFGYADRQIQLK